MGGTVTINPTATSFDNSGWALTGAASKLLAVNDASDASYVQDSNAAATLKAIAFTMGASSLTDGCALQSITPIIRTSQATGGSTDTITVQTTAYKADGTVALQNPSGTSILPATGIANMKAGAAGAYNSPLTGNTAKDIADRIEIAVSSFGQGISNDHRVYKITAEVVYVEPPTAGTLAMTSITTTSKPELTWVLTSPDGLPQYEFQAATWLVSDLASYPGGQAAFDADPEAPFKDALGVGKPSFTGKSAQAWSVDSTGAVGWTRSALTKWTAPQDIANGAMKTYLRVAAIYAGERLYKRLIAGVSTLTYTMAVTAPSALTSITPVWQYPGATSPNQNSLYRTKVTVAYPTQTLGAFTGRRIQVEHAVNGSSNWSIMPLGVQEAGATSGSLIFYDTAPVPGKTMQYRAKAVLWTSTATNGGAYLSPQTAVATFDNLVLRDPLNADTAVVLRIQGDLQESSEEFMTASRGLGSPYPAFVSDAVGGRRWSIQAMIPDEATYLLFQTLRATRSTLVFQTDMLGYWAWARLDASVGAITLRQTNRTTEAKRTRMLTFDLVETSAILGQPQTLV